VLEMRFFGVVRILLKITQTRCVKIMIF